MMFGIHTFAHACVFQMVNDIHSYLRCTKAPWSEKFRGCRIIEIHEALPSDLSIEQRGAVRDLGRGGGGTEQRFSCLLCHFLLGEADPRDPRSASVANGQDAHAEANGVACRASRAEQRQRPHQ